MNLTDKFKRLFPTKDRTDEELLLSPLEGRIIPLEETPDETFATRILGDGVAILPTGGTLFSPADARVDQTFGTAHALTLVTDKGAELLLHVGIDTVELQGRYFELLVSPNDRVRAGDALIRFDRFAIINADYNVITPMVVGNSDEYDLEILTTGDVSVGAPLLKLKRKERRA